MARPEYFGGTAFARGRMVQSRIAGLDDAGRTDLVKGLSAEAALPYQAEDLRETFRVFSRIGDAFPLPVGLGQRDT